MDSKIHKITFCCTRVMAEYTIWEPLQCKSVFNTYLSLGRSNQKVEESGLAFFWPNWSSSELPNPNTNTQIHKYTNTALVKVAHRHNMGYIFEKVMV